MSFFWSISLRYPSSSSAWNQIHSGVRRRHWTNKQPQQFGDVLSETHHQPPHSLLLNALVLLLLLSLGVGVIGGDSLGGLLELRRDGAVVLLEVLGVLQDAVEVFLSTEETHHYY